jgi:branched-chain amino acid transport system substrate-binding protein
MKARQTLWMLYTVIAMLPNVSQFWTYDPAAFLSKPVYSRDYPSCPNCE